VLLTFLLAVVALFLFREVREPAITRRLRTFEETLFSGKRDGGGNVLSPEPQAKAFGEAVVEWVRDHEPAEFARRYGRRRTHVSVVTPPN
jgi:hypothetical protein